MLSTISVQESLLQRKYRDEGFEGFWNFRSRYSCMLGLIFGVSHNRGCPRIFPEGQPAEIIFHIFKKSKRSDSGHPRAFLLGADPSDGIDLAEKNLIASIQQWKRLLQVGSKNS